MEKVTLHPGDQSTLLYTRIRIPIRLRDTRPFLTGMGLTEDKETSVGRPGRFPGLHKLNQRKFLLRYTLRVTTKEND